MNLWSIGLFGSLGALLRYFLGVWTGTWWELPFPMGTLLINLSGSLILGWFSTWTYSLARIPSWLKVGFGTGFVGAYTTFSTFSVEMMTLMNHHLFGLAFLYILISSLGGIACAWLGYEIYRRQARQKKKGYQTS